MAVPTDNPSMAVFCDFENVALGVRDAKYDKFDIKRVLERLLLKGSIVVKKAYCDWERYKAFKGTMHEASFELIEIPHVRQSGKNSADIRLVVDALDLCYTKTHVDTFVIISGDSDFSPLVSKLRENAKQVIGVGVKQSTSDLLIANCDEFIFYDDLVRDNPRGHAPARRSTEPASEPAPAAGKPAAEADSTEAPRRKEDSREEAEARRRKAIDLAHETFEALMAERGTSGRIWASVLKDAIKRRRPDFNEGYFGFRTFGSLLDEAQARGLLEVGRDEKSNTYVRRLSNTPSPVREAAPVEQQADSAVAPAARAQESRPAPAAEAPVQRDQRHRQPPRERSQREPREEREPRESREPQDSRDRHAARKARLARESPVAAPASAAAAPVTPAPAAPAPTPAPQPSAPVATAPAATKSPRNGARNPAGKTPPPAAPAEAPPSVQGEPTAVVPAKKAARKRPAEGAGTTAAKSLATTARKSARKATKPGSAGEGAAG